MCHMVFWAGCGVGGESNLMVFGEMYIVPGFGRSDGRVFMRMDTLSYLFSKNDLIKCLLTLNYGVSE